MEVIFEVEFASNCDQVDWKNMTAKISLDGPGWGGEERTMGPLSFRLFSLTKAAPWGTRVGFPHSSRTSDRRQEHKLRQPQFKEKLG